MEVKMFESVEFARGWKNVPSAVRVRVETLGSREVEVYGVTVKFGAKLGGLRYFFSYIITPVSISGFVFGTRYSDGLVSRLWLLS